MNDQIEQTKNNISQEESKISKINDALTSVASFANINAQETDLVILKQKVLVKPLTGLEEQSLKTGNETLNTFVKNFNKILYKKCEFSKKTPIKDYETFLSHITPQDKALLIYAMTLSSFDNLGTVNQTCEHCGEDYPLEIKPEELWHQDSAPKPWDLNKNPFEYINTQPIMNGKIIINLRLPTEKDRFELMDFLDKKIDQNMETESGMFSIIDTLAFLTHSIVVDPDSAEPNTLEENEDILNFLQNLPLKIKDIVVSEIDLTVFDKYMPSLYQESLCTRCHKQNKTPINIEISFFRKSLLLLSEV